MFYGKPFNNKMMLYKLISLLLIGVCSAIRYDNYTLFRGIPSTEKHLNFFQNLTLNYDINFWREPGLLRMPVEFIVAPENKTKFLQAAKDHGVYLTTLMEDVQSAFDLQTVKPYIRRRMGSFNWQTFYRLDDIYAWLQDLEREYSSELTLESIGKTHEGRDIVAARIILRGSLRRSKVIIEGGIHAREWISPAFVTYLLHQILLSQSSSNQKLRDIGRTYTWYFVPVVNPDGYEYTHKTDRLWRKNRSERPADLNRNFDVKFGTTGVSFNPTADIFCGDSAFSEKESIALANFISSRSDRLEYYISFHSYGQYMIMPYAHSKLHHENYEEMRDKALQAAAVIKSFNGKVYTAGTAYDTVGYTVSGASTCWTKYNFKVPYVMTFELRDRGTYGFGMPPDEIMPTCKETLAGVLSLLKPHPASFDRVTMDYKNTHAQSRVESVESGRDRVHFCAETVFIALCVTVVLK